MTWQEISNLIRDNVEVECIVDGMESTNGDFKNVAVVGLKSSQGNIFCGEMNPQDDTEMVEILVTDIIAQMIAEKVVPVVIQQERERIAKGFETHAKSLSTTIGDSDIEYKDFLGGFLWGSVMVLKRIVEGVDA